MVQIVHKVLQIRPWWWHSTDFWRSEKPFTQKLATFIINGKRVLNCVFVVPASYCMDISKLLHYRSFGGKYTFGGKIPPKDGWDKYWLVITASIWVQTLTFSAVS